VLQENWIVISIFSRTEIEEREANEAVMQNVNNVRNRKFTTIAVRRFFHTQYYPKSSN
jgi:hypothetical protein